MLTIDNIIQEFETIYNALEQVEVKGKSNRDRLSFVQDRCRYVQNELSKALQEIQNEGNKEVEPEPQQ